MNKILMCSLIISILSSVSHADALIEPISSAWVGTDKGYFALDNRIDTCNVEGKFSRSTCLDLF